MKIQSLSRRMAVVAVLALAATTMIGVTSASAAALTDTTWSVSNNQTGATGVTYTFEFTTATAGTIGNVTATVPTGTAVGTVGFGQVWGLGAGTASFAANTLTYTLTTAQAVAANVPLYIEFTGLTNTTTAGDNTSTVTTMDNATTPAAIDTVTSPSVSFGAASTAVTVQIPKSLTFTNDTPSFTMQLDPSLTALSTVSKAVTVTVATNAGQGYTLAAKDTGLISGSNTITFASTGVATGVASASFAANTIGVSATKTITGGSLAAIQGAGLAVSGNFVGYTTGGETFLSASKPTGNTADSLVLTNQVKIDYTTPAGTYTDTITYTATPTY